MKKFLVIATLILSWLTLPCYAIKVGLIDGVTSFSMGTSTPAAIVNISTNKGIFNTTKMVVYRIKAYGNTIAIEIGGQFYDTHAASIVIKPSASGLVSAKNRWYRGIFIVTNREGKLIIINELPIEEYLLGVVPSEMPSGWNYEAHKAQAIAARSYAIANRGKRANHGYDLKDTPEDQAYGGASSETRRTNSAVQETSGIVLTYDKKIVSAYYSASAGGQTTTSGAVWNRNLPYLHSVPSFDVGIAKNGHGVGMSQHGANNLAAKGYNAYQILSYFYNNVGYGKIRPEWHL